MLFVFVSKPHFFNVIFHFSYDKMCVQKKTGEKSKTCRVGIGGMNY